MAKGQKKGGNAPEVPSEAQNVSNVENKGNETPDAQTGVPAPSNGSLDASKGSNVQTVPEMTFDKKDHEAGDRDDGKEDKSGFFGAIARFNRACERKKPIDGLTLANLHKYLKDLESDAVKARETISKMEARVKEDSALISWLLPELKAAVESKGKSEAVMPLDYQKYYEIVGSSKAKATTASVSKSLKKLNPIERKLVMRAHLLEMGLTVPDDLKIPGDEGYKAPATA